MRSSKIFCYFISGNVLITIIFFSRASNFLKNHCKKLSQECKEAWEDYEREKVNPNRGIYGNFMEQTQANMNLLHDQG